VLFGRRLDRLPPLGESALDMTRDRGSAEAVAGPLDGVAGALELARQCSAVDCTRSFLGPVELATDDGAPGTIPDLRQFEVD
jgi:hypothetical protein